MSISAVGLTKTFDGGKSFALRNVNVKIEQGEFVAIIGLSGAGKSTFLRSINGMNVPTSGDLHVLDTQVNQKEADHLPELRKQIGFIFQQFNLVKNITALENVLCGRSAYVPLWRSLTGLYGKDQVDLGIEALNSVGLRGRYHEKVRNLSGGQQQRVAIARALVQQPKIILADEPMASLDPKLSEIVLGILADINSTRKITVLVNIHVLELARKYAKRILAFRQGELVFDGPSESLTDADLESVYSMDGHHKQLH